MAPNIALLDDALVNDLRLFIAISSSPVCGGSHTMKWYLNGRRVSSDRIGMALCQHCLEDSQLDENKTSFYEQPKQSNHVVDHQITGSSTKRQNFPRMAGKKLIIMKPMVAKLRLILCYSQLGLTASVGEQTFVKPYYFATRAILVHASGFKEGERDWI